MIQSHTNYDENYSYEIQDLQSSSVPHDGKMTNPKNIFTQINNNLICFNKLQYYSITRLYCDVLQYDAVFRILNLSSILYSTLQYNTASRGS